MFYSPLTESRWPQPLITRVREPGWQFKGAPGTDERRKARVHEGPCRWERRPAAGRPPDLVTRHFTAERPNQLWVADLTYMATWRGPTRTGRNMSIESQLIEALRRIAPVFLRLALGGAFLSAVADRFGLWGARRHEERPWGDFANFMQCTAQLNPWAPAALIPTLAWVSTAAELVLGVEQVLGLFIRWAALLSGILLLMFAGGMSMGTGVKSALNYSVFSAAAAAFTLVVLWRRALERSVDRWRGN